jgi:hypothetical protein
MLTSMEGRNGLLRAWYTECRSSQWRVSALDTQVSTIAAHSAEETKALGRPKCQKRNVQCPACDCFKNDRCGCEASRVIDERFFPTDTDCTCDGFCRRVSAE